MNEQGIPEPRLGCVTRVRPLSDVTTPMRRASERTIVAPWQPRVLIRRPTPAAKPSARRWKAARPTRSGCGGSFAGYRPILAARRATHRSGCPARSSRARWVGGAGRRTRGSAIAATRGCATTGLSGVEIDGHDPVRRCPRFDDAGRTGRPRRIPNADQPLLPDRQRCPARHGRPRRQVHRRRRDGDVHPGDVRPRPRLEGYRTPRGGSSNGSRMLPKRSGCRSGSASTRARHSWAQWATRPRSRTSRRSATR